jgi:hypothetical protein
VGGLGEDREGKEPITRKYLFETQAKAKRKLCHKQGGLIVRRTAMRRRSTMQGKGPSLQSASASLGGLYQQDDAMITLQPLKTRTTIRRFL